jgi:hypothetical protein
MIRMMRRIRSDELMKVMLLAELLQGLVRQARQDRFFRFFKEVGMLMAE